MIGLLSTVHQILALDIGEKRIGVARAQSQARLTEALAVIEVDGRSEYEKLTQLLNQYQPAVLVVGLPLNLAGQPTLQTKFVQDWVSAFLEKVAFQGRLVYQDETLSTQVVLDAAEKTKAKCQLDSQAARVILEDYLQGEENA